MDVSIPRALAPLLLLLGPPLASGAEEPPEKPATPAEELQALVKEFFEAARIYSYTGTTDEERTPVLARVEKLQPRLLQLAAKNPRDPVALDALVQAVTLELWFENNTTHPCWGEDSPGRKAIALLLRDHIRDDKLGEACRRMAYGFSRECEGFLRAALEMNPHQEVQALACLRLAQCLHARQQKLDLIRERPEMAARYEGLFGRDYLQTLQSGDRAKAIAEVESFFERAAEKYGDAKVPYGGTVGEKAKSELYEIRHLSAGKEAREIEGEDQDGKRFKLSDYRGKVVLLYFWSEY